MPSPVQTRGLLEFALLVVGLAILVLLAVYGLEALQAGLSGPSG